MLAFAFIMGLRAFGSEFVFACLRHAQNSKCSFSESALHSKRLE